MQAHQNQIINLCMPLFEVVQHLRSGCIDLNADTLYQSMMTLEHQCLEKQIASHFISDTQYALAALIDEAVMLSSWSGKTSWMDQSLQLRLFGEHLAGVNFFERLAAIRQKGDLNLPVLEVYYVCLQLGFQGKYALTQQEELKALQVSIKHQLDLYKGSMSPVLSCDLDKIQHEPLRSKTIINPKMICIAGLFIMSLLYAAYALQLHVLEKEPSQLIEKVLGELS